MSEVYKILKFKTIDEQEFEIEIECDVIYNF